MAVAAKLEAWAVVVKRVLPDDSVPLHRHGEKEKKHPEPDLDAWTSEACGEKVRNKKDGIEWTDASLTMLVVLLCLSTVEYNANENTEACPSEEDGLGRDRELPKEAAQEFFCRYSSGCDLRDPTT